ncbi:MAG: outer membrane lipoprotein-sorting protein [Proteobacteria bacterium]|nr:outer membrane lipoprotein-sorting protein [Pseudomonadota bacterium]
MTRQMSISLLRKSAAAVLLALPVLTAATPALTSDDPVAKTLVSSNFKQYLDKYWRPLTMHMENHQTGKKTTLTFTDYKFRQDIKDSDFTKSRLKKAR